MGAMASPDPSHRAHRADGDARGGPQGSPQGGDEARGGGQPAAERRQPGGSRTEGEEARPLGAPPLRYSRSSSRAPWVGRGPEFSPSPRAGTRVWLTLHSPRTRGADP